MKACELVNLIRASGASLTLLPSGRLKLTGADVDRWLPVLAQYEQELISTLRQGAPFTERKERHD